MKRDTEPAESTVNVVNVAKDGVNTANVVTGAGKKASGVRVAAGVAKDGANTEMDVVAVQAINDFDRCTTNSNFYAAK